MYSSSQACDLIFLRVYMVTSLASEKKKYYICDVAGVK